MNITAKTVPLGVIGCPVSHSVSPEIHNFLIDRLELGYFYAAYPVPPEGLAAAFGGMKALGIRGLNVTVPHKEGAFALCDRLDDYAAEIGAVNTVVNEGGRLVGYNTDAPGFIMSLARAGVDPSGRDTVLLGAGGAARGVASALLKAGASRLRIINRTRERAERLAAELSLLYPNRVTAALSAEGAELLVNTTSAGMKNGDSAFSDYASLAADCVVCDIVYCPRETPFLKGAKAAGLKTVGGIGMLIYQAVIAFERFTGVSPSEEDVESLFRRMEMKKSIALTGFMGCGKSVIGRELAQMCAAEYVDCDDYIAERAGRPIPRIFKEEGEAGFRDRESRAIAELSGRGGRVISLGGGAVLRPENIARLRESCFIVRIKADVEKILRNTAGDRSRPLIEGKTPEQVAALLAEREPYYANCDFTVDVTNSCPNQSARLILDKITERA